MHCGPTLFNLLLRGGLFDSHGEDIVSRLQPFYSHIASLHELGRRSVSALTGPFKSRVSTCGPSRVSLAGPGSHCWKLFVRRSSALSQASRLAPWRSSRSPNCSTAAERLTGQREGTLVNGVPLGDLHWRLVGDEAAVSGLLGQRKLLNLLALHVYSASSGILWEAKYAAIRYFC